MINEFDKSALTEVPIICGAFFVFMPDVRAFGLRALAISLGLVRDEP